MTAAHVCPLKRKQCAGILLYQVPSQACLTSVGLPRGAELISCSGSKSPSAFVLFGTTAAALQASSGGSCCLSKLLCSASLVLSKHRTQLSPQSCSLGTVLRLLRSAVFKRIIILQKSSFPSPCWEFLLQVVWISTDRGNKLGRVHRLPRGEGEAHALLLRVARCALKGSLRTPCSAEKSRSLCSQGPGVLCGSCCLSAHW